MVKFRYLFLVSRNVLCKTYWAEMLLSSQIFMESTTLGIVGRHNIKGRHICVLELLSSFKEREGGEWERMREPDAKTVV